MNYDESTKLAQINEEAPASCPVHDAAPARTASNQSWWPQRLNLRVLAKNPPAINPLGAEFDYADAFNALDLAQVKQDISELLTTSQDFWPADFGHYGPLMIRMAWHSAGTYRIQDGRGGAGSGQQRFAPLNSWPDNVGLDKARRLLWPVKKKYGASLSWADLMVLAGNVALESMGFKTIGFAGGRSDAWEPDDDVYWGPEQEWLADQRYRGERDLENPLAAVQMGLIYVNPEGPNGNSDPLSAAFDIRETFKRMAMDDAETVALIAGGHSFGKTHGAGDAAMVGPEPEAAPMEQLGLGWRSTFGSGKGADAMGSGLEVTWTKTPAKYSHDFFEHLFGFEWEQVASPAGATQWQPTNGAGAGLIPGPAPDSPRRVPTMLTTDLSLRFDPIYGPISRRFLDHPEEFDDAFAKAWFKLTHRDLGPVSRYQGAEVPTQEFLWQDPLPPAVGDPLTDAEIEALKAKIAGSGLSVSQLVKTAWASAASYRSSDRRGGANGARVRLEPQRGWAVNEPELIGAVLEVLEGVRDGSNASLADVIVLAGNVGVEQAAKAAGFDVRVPFSPGRVDATQEQTDVEADSYLEPAADGFRNFEGPDAHLPAEFALVDRANQLGLSAPQMTVLVGGLRVLGANTQGSTAGVLTDRVGTLSNDFFVNLLDLETTWVASDSQSRTFAGRKAGQHWTATRADLVFGSNAELRAVAEVYAADDATGKFVADFVEAWVKVMDNDRFDLHR